MSLVFEYLPVGPLDTNCYIVADGDSGEAAVIDPGGDVDLILETAGRRKLRIVKIVNTHAHFDHASGNRALAKATGAKIFAHRSEALQLSHLSVAAMFFGLRSENSPDPDGFLDEGDLVEVGAVKMKVIHTPGHSEGSISLFIEGQGKAIIGDTVFQGSIGRTDFPGGSYDVLIRSIKEKIFALGDGVELYPGHGPPTTVAEEKRHNPFLK